MRKWTHYFGGKDTLLSFVYQLAIGMLGALIVWLMLLFLHPQHETRVATVNITGIVNGFIKSQASLHVSQDVLNARVKDFAKTLDDTLHTVASEKHVVLLPSEAVIAGAADYTDVVKQKMPV